MDRISVQIYTVGVLEVNKHKQWCLQQTELTSSLIWDTGTCFLNCSPLITADLQQVNVVFTHFGFTDLGDKVGCLVKIHPGQHLQVAPRADTTSFICVFIDFLNSCNAHVQPNDCFSGITGLHVHIGGLKAESIQ